MAALLATLCVKPKYAHMDNDNYGRRITRCLECGDRILYGRTDKKFCCESCRQKHFYSTAKETRIFKRKVLAILSRNHEILENLIREGKDSADLMELVLIGFVPWVITSYRRSGKHDEYNCFNIKYIMTRTRIYSIVKIRNLSVNLQAGMNTEDKQY
mgnify:FL=1